MVAVKPISAASTSTRLVKLLGDNPAVPAESPLSWAVLAAARRQIGQPQVAPSAQPTVAAVVVNSAPVITGVAVGAPSVSTGAVTATVTASDPNGDKLTYRATTSGKGTVAITTAGVFTYTPTAKARHDAALTTADALLTADAVTVTVTDPAGAKAVTTVTVPITAKNAGPTAQTTVNAPNTGNGYVGGKVAGVDADRDLLIYSVNPTTAKGGTVTVNGGGAFAYTPTAAARHNASALSATLADKTDSFVVTVDDGHGAPLAVTVTVAISPKNVAPTGKTTIGPRDVNSGVVTGFVVGSDVDGDTMTYAGPATTAKGTFALRADGSFTYTPTAAARDKAAAFTGPLADKVDTFSVNVADGHGGTVAVPVNITISPSNTIAANGQTTFCGCTLMPTDTIFHADVRALPVKAQSGAWMNVLGASRGATLKANWGYTWQNATAGMPVNVIGATARTEKVIFNRGYATSGPSIDSRPYAIPDRPIVEGMPSAPAWDRHLLVFQEGTCISQELYNVANGVELPANSLLDALGNAVYRAMYGSSWVAEAGVHYDMSSPYYPTTGWANAARLPYLPMILRPDDLARGSIDHMLGIVISKDRGTGFSWPAGSGDGNGTNGVPMGSVLRLRADFDMSGYSASTQVVLKALQEHGAVIYDSTVAGQDGAKLLAMSNGWAGTEHLTAQAELNQVPMSAFDVVDLSGILVDPAVGWQIRQ
ncbi:Ig-like domain-containing protein [Mycobacterium sp. NBC_00419]|uniref:Ig-like domain-containing protein n=1 Tax=Mycobacterium sp. NBC_00419 TaxID=2975989 RepID=UPI002E1BB24B